MTISDDLGFEPISRQTVSSQIRTQLLRRITTGELAPGATIPSERDLAEQFRVARTSVREAIQGLLSLGVIERRGNRSFVVEHLPQVIVGSDADREGFVSQLFETRRVLEVPVFALAACRADDDQRGQVAVLAALFQSELSISDFRRLDREFHTTIALACRNPLLIELYGKVLDQLFRSQEFDALLNSEQNRSKVERIVAASSAAHALIAAAFASRDSAAMREASEAHLTEVEQSMIDDLV